jgi:hypothetical protein
MTAPYTPRRSPAWALSNNIGMAAGLLRNESTRSRYLALAVYYNIFSQYFLALARRGRFRNGMRFLNACTLDAKVCAGTCAANIFLFAPSKKISQRHAISHFVDHISETAQIPFEAPSRLQLTFSVVDVFAAATAEAKMWRSPSALLRAKQLRFVCCRLVLDARFSHRVNLQRLIPCSAGSAPAFLEQQSVGLCWALLPQQFTISFQVTLHAKVSWASAGKFYFRFLLPTLFLIPPPPSFHDGHFSEKRQFPLEPPLRDGS